MGGRLRLYWGGMPTPVGLDLEITSVKGNFVKGILKNNSPGNCRGEYEMVGKLDGNALGMRSAKPGGLGGDCKFGFRAIIEGNKMTGSMPNATDMFFTKK